MSRRAKGPAFKMRSTNRTTFKEMGSSPIKGKLDDFLQDLGSKLKEGLKSRKTDDAEYKSGRKPGESKWQWRKRKGPKTETVAPEVPEVPEVPTAGESEGSTVGEQSPNVVSIGENFGITDAMSFSNAFRQAGKGGAKEGDIFKWNDKDFKYELK